MSGILFFLRAFIVVLLSQLVIGLNARYLVYSQRDGGYLRVSSRSSLLSTTQERIVQFVLILALCASIDLHIVYLLFYLIQYEVAIVILLLMMVL